jgi:hypothetical protein
MALREAYDTQPAKEAIFPVTTHTKVPLVSSETVTATDIFQRTSIKEESRRADSNRFTAHYELALTVSACCLVVSESAANARFLADSLFNLVRLMSPDVAPIAATIAATVPFELWRASCPKACSYSKPRFPSLSPPIRAHDKEFAKSHELRL